MNESAKTAGRESAAPRIVVVDDNDLFRESLEQNLSDAGYCVADFGSGAEALAHLARGAEADLVLLDWKMPGMNGIEVLQRLRQTSPDLPVIFLTVLSDQIYEEAALTGGAVDFVEKSRSFSILLKRVRLILEGPKARGAAPQAEGETETTGDVTAGDLVLRPEIGRAYWKGRQVDLSITEFRMVHLMASRAGNDVRYRQLYDLVHGEGFAAGSGTEGYRANVRTAIKRIRQKFRDVDSEFDAIENYPGFGYRWRAETASDG